MGKKSTRENKNVYQIAREELELTREKASEKLEYISSDRIEKIESGKSLPHPDEILMMAEKYRAPHLCNYFCSQECQIGQKYVPKVEMKNLSQIVLEVLACLNALEKEKGRLVEISVDGAITEDEIPDFKKIQEELATMSATIRAMQLWVEKEKAEGNLGRARE